MALQLPQSETGIRAWNRFAKTELQGADGFSECLKRTLYRPRDILELLNHAAQTAIRNGRVEIVQDDVDGVKIPRFRGHPNWRDNAPGVIHGQAKEAT
jgi:hypothetical protein